MEVVNIRVEKREGIGKEAAGRIRAGGRIPGVFYGPKQAEALPIQMDEIEFARKLGILEGSHLIQFSSEDPSLKDRMVLLREVQTHPVNGRVLHTDFYEVDLKKKIEVEVALHFVGEPPGVERGGILDAIRREIVVECLPTQIPDYLEVDVSGLEIHDSVHVAELELPEGVEAVYDENFTVVTVSPPTVEEAPVEEAAPAEAEEEAAEAEGAEEGEAKEEKTDEGSEGRDKE